MIRRLRGVLERFGLVASRPGENVYDAFISYSHAVDGELAPALQRGLQRFAKPWYRLRALRIFRDEASLSANPDLWASIQEALERSGFFILLASPEASSSPWVAREAQCWRDTKPIGNLLVALTGGELVWDEHAADFDWAQTTALPVALRGAFRKEPRYIDVRWARTGMQLSLGYAPFRDAVADLAATIHGRDKDEIAGDDVRQHRRTMRLARAAAIALVTLTAASVFFAAFSLLQRNEARRQRDVATSRGLVQAAAANLDTRLDRAMLLSLEAYRVHSSADTRSGLVSAAVRSDHMTRLLHANQSVGRIAVSSDGKLVAAAGSQTVVVWNLRDQAGTRTELPVSGARAMAFSPDGETLAVGGPRSISIWSVPAGRRTKEMAFAGTLAIAFRARGRLIDAVGPPGMAEWLVTSARRSWLRPEGSAISAAAYTLDGDAVALGGLNELRLMDNAKRARSRRFRLSKTPRAVAFSRDATRVAALALQGDEVFVWKTATGKILQDIDLDRVALSVTFAPDGRTLVIGAQDGTVELRRASGRSLVFHGPVERILDVTFPAAGPMVVAGEEGTISLWDPYSSALHHRLAAVSPVFGVDFAGSTNAVAVGGFDDSVKVWSAGSTRNAILRTLPARPDQETKVAISADGKEVAVAASGVSLYDGVRGRVLQRGRDRVRALAFSDEGLLASGERNAVGLWEARNARRLPGLPLAGTPNDLAFGAHGKVLAVATDRGSELWDVDGRRSLDHPVTGRPVAAIAITQSGRLVASAMNGTVAIWDTQRHRNQFAVATSPNAAATVTFTPDERTLAIGTAEGQLVLVDVRSGQRLGPTLSTPGGPVSDLDFNDDGTLLATGTEGGIVTLWDDLLWRDDEALRHRLCVVAGRNLTPAEWSAYIPGESYQASCPSL